MDTPRAGHPGCARGRRDYRRAPRGPHAVGAVARADLRPRFRHPLQPGTRDGKPGLQRADPPHHAHRRAPRGKGPRAATVPRRQPHRSAAAMDCLSPALRHRSPRDHRRRRRHLPRREQRREPAAGLQPADARAAAPSRHPRSHAQRPRRPVHRRGSQLGSEDSAHRIQAREHDARREGRLRRPRRAELSPPGSRDDDGAVRDGDDVRRLERDAGASAARVVRDRRVHRRSHQARAGFADARSHAQGHR